MSEMSVSLRRWCGLIIVLVVPLGSVHAQDASRRTVGPEVEDALVQDGSVDVVMALDAPPALRRKQRPGAHLRRTAINRQVHRLQAEVLSSVSGSGFRTTNRYESVPAMAGTLTSAAALDRLAAHPNVRRIGLDAGGRAALRASVEAVRADRWHSEGVTGEGATVAVLDSGLDTDHVDLADDLVHEACFLHPSDSETCPNGNSQQTGLGAAEDDNGHGTNVTGIITAAGTRAPRGVAPDAEIVGVKVLNSENRFLSYAQIIDALDYLINHPELGVRVINMSLGTDQQFRGVCDNTTAYNMAGADAVAMLRSQGVLPVASSMNRGSGTKMGSPACLSGVVSVGAAAEPRQMAEFSNSNPALDLAAPGVGIRSTGLENRMSTYSGTSQAAPHAAGCAALLHAAGTDTTAAQVEASLKTSPVQTTDPTNELRFPFLDCYTPRATVVVNKIQADPETNRPATPSFILRWQTVRERNSAAFVVERRPGGLPEGPSGDAEWTPVEQVSSKAPDASSDDTLRYRFEGTVPTPGRYAFRLRHATQEGPPAGRPTRAATVLDVPFEGAVSLGGPQPNPAQGRVEFEIVVEEAQEVRVTLYDVLGRRVRRLYEGRLRAKRPFVLQADTGTLASGTYFVRAVGDQFVSTRRMIVAE